MINWTAVATMPWRDRNSMLEGAMRRALEVVPSGDTVSTWDLCLLIDPAVDGAGRSKMSQCLTRMAPYVGPFATHDGEEIIRYGQKRRRWRWHGFGKATPATGGQQ